MSSNSVMDCSGKRFVETIHHVESEAARIVTDARRWCTPLARQSIYFIRASEDVELGPVKIGRAEDPWKRLRALQGANAAPLFLVSYTPPIPAAGAVEAMLHRYFAELRLEGEWFRSREDVWVASARLTRRPEFWRGLGVAA